MAAKHLFCASLYALGRKALIFASLYAFRLRPRSRLRNAPHFLKHLFPVTIHVGSARRPRFCVISDASKIWTLPPDLFASSRHVLRKFCFTGKHLRSGNPSCFPVIEERNDETRRSLRHRCVSEAPGGTRACMAPPRSGALLSVLVSGPPPP